MPCTKPVNIDKNCHPPVLITGADGYLGGVLTKRLLLEGFKVHGTIFPGSMNTERVEYLYGILGGVCVGANSS